MAAIHRERHRAGLAGEAGDRRRVEAAGELEDLAPEEREAYRAELRAELAREEDEAATRRAAAAGPPAAREVADRVAEKKYEATGRTIPGKL